jgi:hypothetical protein
MGSMAASALKTQTSINSYALIHGLKAVWPLLIFTVRGPEGSSTYSSNNLFLPSLISVRHKIS